MSYNYSFIIPHKNRPDLLERCVDSIPERDDVQIIVVDDNSDEGKKPSLKERKNLQVILLDAQQSKGAGKARNVGLERSKGKWLLFPDSDDYYNDGFLDILDRYRNREIDVLYFNIIYRDGNTGNILPLKSFHRCFDKYDGRNYSKDLVKFHHKEPWTKMVSHDYINKYNIHFEVVPNGNDIFFSMSVGFYTNNIVVEKEPLYTYMLNNNSILTTRETPNAALCRLSHLIKLNYFYDHIGHPEWKRSVIKRVLLKIWTLKFSFLRMLVVNSSKLYKDRKEWINIICK